MALGLRERYKIVGASWVVSIIAAFALVNRNKYLTGQQKLVQARVYAQGLTVAVLIATAGFEMNDKKKQRGRYEEVEYIDEKDHKAHKRQVKKPEEEASELDPLWKDLVKQEEERFKERDDEIRRTEERDRKRRAKERKDHPKKVKDEKESVQKRQKDQKVKQQGGEDEEVEYIDPVKGKKGEGKMMDKVSDPPDPNKGVGVR